MNDGRVHGWKAIGAHLGVSDRTAVRWHQTAGMPVHRMEVGGRPAVFARPEELDRWVISQEGSRAQLQHRESGGSAGTGGCDSSPGPFDGGAASPHVDNVAACIPVTTFWASRRLLLYLGAAGVLITAVTGATALLTSPGGGGTRPESSRGLAARPVAVQSAFGHAQSPDANCLELTIGRDEVFRVEASGGGLVTVERARDRKLGLGSSVRGDRLDLFVFELTRPAANSSDRAKQLARLELARGVPSGIEALGVSIAVKWTGVAPATPTGDGLQRCCVACGTLSVCSSRVAGPCGECAATSR